jgi:putative spermidine/putrescine transport system ATP-binding protein
VRERFFLGSQWMYAVTTPVGECTVLCSNDGRPALDEHHPVGVTWPDHCGRVLPTEPAKVAA